MLNLIEIFRDRVSVEYLVLQREVDYQAALKENLDLFIGVGYSSESSEPSLNYSCTYYLVKDNAIHKKYYWRWEYPRIPLNFEKTKAEHLHWINFADIRSTLLENQILKEEDFKIFQARTASCI